MALFKATVVNKNHEQLSSSITYGLNTEKLINYYYDDNANDGSGGIVFFYVENEDRRKKAIRYETADSWTDFASLLDRPFDRRRINLQVVAKGITDEEWIEDVNIDANRIVRVYDNDAGTYGYVEFDNGAFDVLRYKTEELRSEIMAEVSTSVSTST